MVLLANRRPLPRERGSDRRLGFGVSDHLAASIASRRMLHLADGAHGVKQSTNAAMGNLVKAARMHNAQRIVEANSVGDRGFHVL